MEITKDQRLFISLILRSSGFRWTKEAVSHLARATGASPLVLLDPSFTEVISCTPSALWCVGCGYQHGPVQTDCYPYLLTSCPNCESEPLQYDLDGQYKTIGEGKLAAISHHLIFRDHMVRDWVINKILTK